MSSMRPSFAFAGQDPAAPSPTEAATNTKHTSDLLRRFKELTVKEPKDPAGLDQPEIDLRVSFRLLFLIGQTSLISEIIKKPTLLEGLCLAALEQQDIDLALLDETL